MKRFLSVFIAILLVIMQIPNVAMANTNLSKPVLSIENSIIPEVNAGANTSITLTLKNTGTNHANNIMVTPVFSKDSPFTPNNITETILVGNINANSKATVKLDLVISSTADEGVYSIPLDYKYTYNTYDDKTEVLTTNEGKHSETIYVKVGNKTSKPRLIITKVVTNPQVIIPGQDIRASILFQNKGTIGVKNVSVKLEGLNNNGGFYISSGSDIAYIKDVKGNGVTYADFHLKASNNIKSGTHELKATFSYNGVTETQVIYLNVGGDSSQSSNLVLENLEHPTTAIKANNNFILKFDLRNNGGINAKDVLVKVESSDPTIIPKTTSIKKINSIAPNGKESLEFVFSPTEEAVTKNYPLEITIKYIDDLGAESTINQYVGIYVEKSGEDSTKGKPKLIIDKYNFLPQLVRAGENFEMTLSFYNTSSSKTVKNIKIFLTAESGSSHDSPGAGSSAFTPVDSSNTFYIDSIPPRGKIEKTITMFTIPDAIAKTHTITANFEYEDNEGNELKDIELIGVPVVQNSRLETGELSYYPEAMVGQPMPISLEFYNTGKVTLYNMMVKLEGDFQTENGSTYIGNFATGSSEYFEGMVVPSEPGELNGAVLFTYEDSTGQQQELRKEFTLNVMEMPPMEEYPGGEFPPMEEESGGLKGILKSKWLWISLVSIVAIVGGIIFYKKKKKAKEMAFDE